MLLQAREAETKYVPNDVNFFLKRTRTLLDLYLLLYTLYSGILKDPIGELKDTRRVWCRSTENTMHLPCVVSVGFVYSLYLLSARQLRTDFPGFFPFISNRTTPSERM